MLDHKSCGPSAPSTSTPGSGIKEGTAHGGDARGKADSGGSLGQSIREQREALGMSQENLAQACMVSRQTISNWETGKTLPDIQSLVYLAEVFGITVNDLVGRVGPEIVRTVSADRRELQLLNCALIYLLVLVLPLRLAMGEGTRPVPDIPMALTGLIILVGLVAIIARMGVIHRKHHLSTSAQIADYLVGNIQEGKTSPGLIPKYRTELTVLFTALLCFAAGVVLHLFSG